MTTHPASSSQYSEEISLVELAATFLRRRRIFYVVFLFITLAGVTYALLASEKYEYVTLLKLAEKRSGGFVEAPSTVVAMLENRWLPEVQAELRSTASQTFPSGIIFSNPASTGLLRIVSEASQSEYSSVQVAHGQLAERVRVSQMAAVAELKERLQKQIDATNTTVEMLKSQPEARLAYAEVLDRSISLKSQLQSIRPFETLVIGRQGAGYKGPSSTLIVVLGGLLGLMAGVVFAFLAEFASQVKRKMSEE